MSDEDAKVKRGWLPNWSTLRLIGESTVVKVSIAMPFVGYFIIFNSDILSFLSVAVLDETDGDLFPILAPYYRPYFMYYGLFFVGLGSFVFQLACPDIIKKFNNDYSFTKAENEISSLPRSILIAQEIRQHPQRDGVRCRAETNSLIGSLGLTREYYDQPKHFDEEVAKRWEDISLDLFRCYYSLENSSKSASRLISATMFVAGFIVLGVPSVDIFLATIERLIT